MVSVIIPAYNSAQYIQDAIDSVLQQTYSDFEILVMDDGSTDNTQSIIINEYPQVKYHLLQHGGASAARNFGITHAKGDYVAFLDADDKWLPQKLESQVACFKKNRELGMVFTEHLFFSASGVDNTISNKRQRLMTGDIVRNIFKNSYVATPTVMVKREVFSSVGMFRTNLTIGEDDNMWMRIASHFKVELIDQPLVFVRDDANGSITRKNGTIFKGVYRSIRTLEKQYPALAMRIGKKLFRQKYAHIFFNEGYFCFIKKEYSKANRLLLLSILKNPFRFRALLLFYVTLLPSSWISLLLRFKTDNEQQC